MKAKIYVVLEDYDNGESYEDWYSSHREFVNAVGTEEAARQLIRDEISEREKEAKEYGWYEGPAKVEEDHEKGRTVLELPSGCHVEKYEYYIEEKEVTIPD